MGGTVAITIGKFGGQETQLLLLFSCSGTLLQCQGRERKEVGLYLVRPWTNGPLSAKLCSQATTFAIKRARGPLQFIPSSSKSSHSREVPPQLHLPPRASTQANNGDF